MNWDDLKDKVYYVDGSLRDIYVENTTKEDWNAWADFVNNNYRIEFVSELDDIIKNSIDIEKVFAFWEENDNLGYVGRIFIDDIQINTFFNGEAYFENDIIPTEINSMEDHEKLAEYLKHVSKIMNKKVVLTIANSPETPLISVDCEEILFSHVN